MVSTYHSQLSNSSICSSTQQLLRFSFHSATNLNTNSQFSITSTIGNALSLETWEQLMHIHNKTWNPKPIFCFEILFDMNVCVRFKMDMNMCSLELWSHHQWCPTQDSRLSKAYNLLWKYIAMTIFTMKRALQIHIDSQMDIHSIEMANCTTYNGPGRMNTAIAN